MPVCVYFGSIPQQNRLCNQCPLFLETCWPIVSTDGFANGECGCWLCPGCEVDCTNKALVNL